MSALAKIVCFAAVLVALAPVRAEADRLIMYYHDRPPLYQTESDGTVGGIIGERVQAILGLAAQDATWVALPPSSQLRLVRENAEPLCAVGWFRTSERETFAQYSQPIYQDPPLVLVTRKSNAPVMSTNTLGNLFQNRALQAVFRESYSYGLAVDNLMIRHQPIVLNTFDDNLKMIDMVRNKIADYTLINADEAHYLLGIMGDKSKTDGLVTKTLEDIPEGNRRYLICSLKTPQVVLDNLNSAITKLNMISKVN